MTTCSGNSITSMQNSRSEGYDMQVQMDERKRKRMASNRESARRSRMRKQKHLDDLITQVETLKRENAQILENVNLTTQKYLNIEAESCVLKAQMNELSQRLHSLNEILNYINGAVKFGTSSYVEDDSLGDFGYVGDGYYGNFTTSNALVINNNPWNMGFLNQPIMASADVLQY